MEVPILAGNNDVGSVEPVFGVRDPSPLFGGLLCDLTSGRLRPLRRDLLAERFQPIDELLVLLVGERRFERLDVKRAVRFKLAALYLMEAFKTLAMDDGQQLFA